MHEMEKFTCQGIKQALSDGGWGNIIPMGRGLWGGACHEVGGLPEPQPVLVR